ncbi:MAG: CooT family nickel-binding protein [Candidatus Brocadiaceae bacterium]|nr:CooT family nickel-binding protein [Candidatus Brocadiaceae bacterium]
MCQMKVMLDQEGQQELVMENVTQLEVAEKGLKVSTFFEEPKIVTDAAVKTIDFLSGIVTFQAKHVS